MLGKVRTMFTLTSPLYIYTDLKGLVNIQGNVCILLYTHMHYVSYRTDETMPMQPCEPYSLHKVTTEGRTEGVYDECQPSSSTDNTNAVYESMP